ncbi:hypothetical protein W824_13210 [Clavibacter cf. michiganensis LMG 26808]|nr:hypothetical protein W824_13210 [Clavibacter cf. michiganensis LMG 26808]
MRPGASRASAPRAAPRSRSSRTRAASTAATTARPCGSCASPAGAPSSSTRSPGPPTPGARPAPRRWRDDRPRRRRTGWPRALERRAAPAAGRALGRTRPRRRIRPSRPCCAGRVDRILARVAPRSLVHRRPRDDDGPDDGTAGAPPARPADGQPASDAPRTLGG